MAVFIHIILFNFLFSYEVGDKISSLHQDQEFSICYGSELDPNGDGVFTFSEYNGDLNGGQYYVIFLEMGTSW